MQTDYALSRAEYEREVDVTLAGSFPASDPPSWTFGASPWMGFETPIARAAVPAAIDVVYRDGIRVFGVGLAGLGEAIALSAAVPFAILIAGAPVAALVAGIVHGIAWLTG